MRGSHPPHGNIASSGFLFLVLTSNDSNRCSKHGLELRALRRAPKSNGCKSTNFVEKLLFRISVVYRKTIASTHADISYSMISLVVKFVVPCKLRAPDAKTWVVVIEFFNEWTLISRSHHTSQVLVSWSSAK